MATESITWIDPMGVQFPLYVGLNSQLGDLTGRFMPPIDHQEDQLPFQPGGAHRLAIHMDRDVQVPLNTIGTSIAGLRTALRALVYAMDPTRGPGILRSVDPFGGVRELACYYVSGLEGIENVVKAGRLGMGSYVLFRAYDPYWRDVSDTSINWNISQAQSFFPFFPMRLTQSSVAVATTVSNGGDVSTWPVWTITGPGGGADGIVLTSLTLGQSIIFMTTTLGAGEFITIDTRPTSQSPTGKTVTKSDGTNLFPDLDPTSVLWPLLSGSNAVNLSFNNAIVGSTGLQLNYRRKYLSP